MISHPGNNGSRRITQLVLPRGQEWPTAVWDEVEELTPGYVRRGGDVIGKRNLRLSTAFGGNPPERAIQRAIALAEQYGLGPVAICQTVAEFNQAL